MGGPWLNEKKNHNLYGRLSEKLFVTSREDRYDLMCELLTYEKSKENSTGAKYFHGGWPLT